MHPEDLTVILDTLANGGQGEGPAINRQLVNWKTLSDIGVAHDPDTAQFLDDFALLTDTIANHSGDLVAMAQSLNSALPPLNQRGDEVASVLQNLSRVSNDFADVLDANRPFQDKAATEGGQTLDVLSSHVGQIGPLLVGVGQYLEAQAIVGHIPYTDGSYLAAVKLIAGGGAACGQGQACPAPSSSSPPSAPQTPLTSASPSAPGSSPVGLAQLPQMQTGSNGINSLIQGLL